MAPASRVAQIGGARELTGPSLHHPVVGIAEECPAMPQDGLRLRKQKAELPHMTLTKVILGSPAFLCKGIRDFRPLPHDRFGFVTLACRKWRMKWRNFQQRNGRWLMHDTHALTPNRHDLQVTWRHQDAEHTTIRPDLIFGAECDVSNSGLANRLSWT